MLSVLHIENIAVIESVDIEFEPGFNVLTGETGAGKSIVIDSISAVIGERVSRDILRTGAKNATVSAVFTNIPKLPWCESNGILPDDEGQLVLNRKMTSDGKNACRVNGEPVSLSQLKSLGQQLLNIHGQHDSQLLLNEDYHLTYLDLYAGNNEVFDEYSSAYENMRSIREKIDSLMMDEAAKQRRIETLKYQINEIEAVHLREGEWEQLMERRKLLGSVGKISDGLNTAYECLNGNEETEGAVSLIYAASDSLDSLTDLGNDFAQISSRMNDLKYLADDLADELRVMRGEMDFSPEELDEVENRLDKLHRLGKKYGSTTEEIMKFLEDCKTEVDEIESAEDTLVFLQDELKKSTSKAQKAAEKLTRTRTEAGERLEKRLLSELSQLDMNGVRFKVEIEKESLGLSGADRVRFLISANVGEELKAINRVASGGELARVMLAMKNTLADKDLVSTMVFDEADSGVSGKAAARVAEKMAQIARYKQVFCVTHIPITAAMADAQYLVSKEEHDGRTYTSVNKLDHDGRVLELARLIGGDNISSAMLSGAEEQLTLAQTLKNSFT